MIVALTLASFLALSPGKSIVTNPSAGSAAPSTMSGASVTCAAGAGVSALSLDPSCPAAGGIVIAPIINSDSDGCTITVAETSALLGCVTIVEISSSAGGPIKMAAVSNVFVPNATWLPVVGDNLTMVYTDLANDAWVEKAQHYAMRVDDAPLNVSTNGKGNVVIGNNSGLVLNDDQTVTGGLNNTFVGAEVGTLVTTGQQNTYFGSRAGSKNVTAKQQTCLGQGACYNSTVDDTLAVGWHAMLDVTTGANNTAVGSSALQGGTQNGSVTGNDTAIGFNSLKGDTTGVDNTAVGQSSGAATSTGGANVYVGSFTGDQGNGSSNVAVGKSALHSASAGSFEVILGTNSLTGGTGADNTVAGYAAAIDATTMADSVCIGYEACYAADDTHAPTTDQTLTLVGASTNTATATGISNASAFGNGAIADASNHITLGNTAVTQVRTSGAWRSVMTTATSVTAGTCSSETCSSATCDANRGQVTTTCTAGQTTIVTYAATQQSTPICTCTPANAAGNIITLGEMFCDSSTTVLTITFPNAVTAAAVNYTCQQ